MHKTGGASDPSLFFASASKGNTAQVKMLLTDPGMHVNLQDKEGSTALLRAAKEGHAGTVEFLLEQKANPNIVNIFGSTALIEASEGGHAPVVVALLAGGATPGLAAFYQDKKGSTALIAAVLMRKMDIVPLLLATGNANLDYCNEDHLNALSFASFLGQVDTVRLLLAAGATRELETVPPDAKPMAQAQLRLSLATAKQAEALASSEDASVLDSTVQAETLALAQQIEAYQTIISLLEEPPVQAALDSPPLPVLIQSEPPETDDEFVNVQFRDWNR